MEPTRHFDYIVVGCGGVGSASVYWLSKRSNSVLGLEQFKLGHEHGGSQDHSRIIRMAYHDDKYTKLTPETYKAWEEVERESGHQLVHRCGYLLLTGKNENMDTLEKYARAMESNKITFERWSGTELRRRFPQFTVGEETVCLYQKDGGLVDAALANSVHIQLAQAHGATVKDKCPVTRIYRGSDGTVHVNTTRGRFTCRKVVVCAGAWINNVLGSIGVTIPIYVTQEQVTYFATPHPKDFHKDRYPVWVYAARDIDYYALPTHVNSFSKIGVDAAGPLVTAHSRNYAPDPKREEQCVDILKRICPKFLGPVAYSKTCLYTMPPDRTFIVDTCASSGWPEVIVCNGAGHVFKFSCLMGKILTELAVNGTTQYDISGFSINREALTDPNFKPAFVMGNETAPSRL